MKSTINSVYYLLMRTQGACVLAFAAMFWLGLSSSGNSLLLMIVPAGVAAFVTGLAASYAIPYLTPSFVNLPTTRLEMLTTLTVHLVGGIFFIVTIMGGIALFNVGEPTATTLAIGASIVSLAISLALITCCALIYAMGGAETGDSRTVEEDVDDAVRTLPPLDSVRRQVA